MTVDTSTSSYTNLYNTVAVRAAAKGSCPRIGAEHSPWSLNLSNRATQKDKHVRATPFSRSTAQWTIEGPHRWCSLILQQGQAFCEDQHRLSYNGFSSCVSEVEWLSIEKFQVLNGAKRIGPYQTHAMQTCLPCQVQPVVQALSNNSITLPNRSTNRMVGPNHAVT